MKSKWKVVETVLLGVLLVCLLAGCGSDKAPESVEETTIHVSKQGVVTYYIVEDFERDYYNMEELEAMAREEIAVFNESVENTDEMGASLISVGRTPSSDKKVQLVLQFGSWKSYREYSGSILFYGTVADAHANGIDLNVDLVGAENAADLIGERQLYDKGTHHLLVVEEGARIICPKKPQYISPGAVLGEDGAVEGAQAGGPVYILMK